MKQESILYVCGSRGRRAVCGARFEEFGGYPTCYLLRRGDEAVLVDCGTGLYNASPLLRGCSRVDILLTHLHYDHLLGLLDWSVFPPQVQPTFYSTFSDWDCDPLQFCRPPFWPVKPGAHVLQNVSTGEEISLGANVRAEFYKSGHPNEANIVILHTEQSKITILCDYEHGFPVPDAAADCDLLIYDGMFDDTTYPAHRGWGHSTWQQACRCARKLGAKKLLVTHHAPDSSDDQLLAWEKEAQKLFPQTHFARMKQKLQV